MKRLLSYASLILLLQSSGAAVGWAQKSELTLNNAVTVVESSQEPESVRRATEDLLSDFTKVLGHAPRRVERLDQAGPVAILIAERGNVPANTGCTTTEEHEAFAFSIPGPSTGPKHLVCLTGADARGTIYAIYQFSQTYLGVDPMYLWTDKQPAKRSEIALPADFTHVFPSPVFRYRGIFTNDEDQLSGWMPGPKGVQSGLAPELWDNIFETILRLKGNMVVPGSWIFPDDLQVEAASRRGLIVNQHHATPIGLNTARWPKGVPYSLSTHPEILERAWKHAVDTYKPDDEILWSVGLRGLSDQSYADLDPTVRNNEQLLGERVSTAIADQIAIVKARFPNAHFISNLWQEGDRLKREGYLKIPPEVTQVWADSGYGDMGDNGKLEAGEGMYFHVAMQNGEANQLSEMVPVSVIQEELGRYVHAGATGFFLLNTSDIRAVAMTARTAMEIAWGGPPKDAEDADGAVYRRWATEEFGAKTAEPLQSLYKEYFAASIPAEGESREAARKSGKVMIEYGEQHYFTEATLLILNDLDQNQIFRPIGQSPKWSPPRVIAPFVGDALVARLAKDVQECEAAQPRWDKVWADALAAEKLVDPSRRNYYEAEVLTMIAINREGNRMLLDLATAMQASAAGHPQEAKLKTADALKSFEPMKQSMATAEYGKWKNWYRGDWLTGVRRTQTYVQDYADHLEDPMAPLPAPMLWNDWEAYAHIMAYEGNRTVDVQ